jgi:hypothetical protein
MAESREPPFSKERRGFFILTSVVHQKKVRKKGGAYSLVPPFLSRR